MRSGCVFQEGIYWRPGTQCARATTPISQSARRNSGADHKREGILLCCFPAILQSILKDGWDRPTKQAAVVIRERLLLSFTMESDRVSRGAALSLRNLTKRYHDSV